MHSSFPFGIDFSVTVCPVPSGALNELIFDSFGVKNLVGMPFKSVVCGPTQSAWVDGTCSVTGSASFPSSLSTFIDIDLGANANPGTFAIYVAASDGPQQLSSFKLAARATLADLAFVDVVEQNATTPPGRVLVPGWNEFPLPGTRPFLRFFRLFSMVSLGGAPTTQLRGLRFTTASCAPPIDDGSALFELDAGSWAGVNSGSRYWNDKLEVYRKAYYGVTDIDATIKAELAGPLGGWRPVRHVLLPAGGSAGAGDMQTFAPPLDGIAAVRVRCEARGAPGSPSRVFSVTDLDVLYGDASVAYGRPAFASSSASTAAGPAGVADHDGFTSCAWATAWASKNSSVDEWVGVDLALTPAPRSGARNVTGGVSISAVHVVLGARNSPACGGYVIEVLAAASFAVIRNAEGRGSLDFNPGLVRSCDVPGAGVRAFIAAFPPAPRISAHGLTIEVWVKLARIATPTSMGAVIAHPGSSLALALHYVIGPHRVVVALGRCAPASADGYTTLALGRWTHVVGVWAPGGTSWTVVDGVRSGVTLTCPAPGSLPPGGASTCGRAAPRATRARAGAAGTAAVTLGT